MRGDGREVLKKLRGEQVLENPLEIIGLSQAILDLSLSGDELYDHCKRGARGLMAIVHPDRHGGAETPAVKRFSEAVDLLNNRAVFNSALAQFRQRNVYYRQGEKTLRTQIGLLQSETNRLRSDLAEKEIAFKTTKRFQDWLPGYLLGEAMTFNSFNGKVRPVAQTQQIIAVALELVFSGPPKKEGMKEFKARYEALGNYPGLLGEPMRGPFRSLVARYSLDAILLGDFIERVRETDLVCPSVRWDFGIAMRELGAPRIADGRVRQAIKPGDIAAQGLAQPWRDFLECLTRRFGDRYVSEATLVTQKINLADRILFKGNTAHKMKYLVVGTAPCKEAFMLIKPQSSYARILLEEEILPLTEPFLAPGRAIVAIPAPDSFTLRGKAENQWNHLIGKRKKEKERDLFFLSHVILDVPCQSL